MAIKKYKPTTNGRRGMSTLSNEEMDTLNRITDKGRTEGTIRLSGLRFRIRPTVVKGCQQDHNSIQSRRKYRATWDNHGKRREHLA